MAGKKLKTLPPPKTLSEKGFEPWRPGMRELHCDHVEAGKCELCHPAAPRPHYVGTRLAAPDSKPCVTCGRIMWEHFPWVFGLDGKSVAGDPCVIYNSGPHPGMKILSTDPLKWEF